jgi:hypothetical protein
MQTGSGSNQRSGREADHSSPSVSDVKNAWSFDSPTPYTFMTWCLIRYGDFTFDLYLESVKDICWVKKVTCLSVRCLSIVLFCDVLECQVLEYCVIL